MAGPGASREAAAESGGRSSISEGVSGWLSGSSSGIVW